MHIIKQSGLLTFPLHPRGPDRRPAVVRGPGARQPPGVPPRGTRGSWSRSDDRLNDAAFNKW